MRLRAGQLTSHLKQSGLAPVYLISGDEPLQVLECADEIRHVAKSQGFDERIVFDAEKGFDWNLLLEESANMSLFSSKKLIELRLNNAKPGNEGGAVLSQYSDAPPPDNVLVITSGKLDRATQNTKWFKALDNAGITIQVWPVDAQQMPAWIQQRVKQQGKTIDQTAAAIIAERVEGNMLAAKQEIDKLCLLINKPEITENDILSAVADSARFDVFEMLAVVQSGQPERAVRMLQGLQEEGVEAAKIYGALMWEFRQLCSMAYMLSTGVPMEKVFADFRVWENKRRPYKMVLQRHPLSDMYKILRYAIRIDRKIKSADKDIVWNQLQSLLLALAGKPLMKLDEDFAH